MTRRTDAQVGETVEVTIRLQPVRENGTVHVQGSVEAGGESVEFSGWLALLDSLERLAERVIGDGGDEAADG